MIVYSKDDDIRFLHYFEMCQLKARLKMELVGLKGRGKTAYSVIKSKYGFKGNRESVLEQLKTKIEEML